MSKDAKDAKSDDLVELKSKYGFWLKPVAKLNISVQLPQLSTGKAISTTSVMEKINKRAKLQFKSLKITKTTIDFLRLEGELESLKQLDIVEQRLDRVKIKLEGFDEQLKLKANKVKIGPFKHDWETFFRDNPQMGELKPGYRPDTVVIQNLPLKWFSNNDTLKTNWLISVFSVFGEIRRFHIPLLDEIEKEKQASAKKNNSSPGFKKFNFNSDNATFDVYLMYKDYVGFVNAMDGLRGMKLIKSLKEGNNAVEHIEHDIKLDFDRTKHLSDKAIRRRQIAKKYGINSLEDLNEYKKKAKERKALYEQRMKQVKKQRKSSKNLLAYLARLVEIEEKKREEEEQRALNEKLLKERLIEEEKKLRNKLIERQRSLQREKLKGQDDLKDEETIDESYDNHSSNNHRAYNHSHDRSSSNRFYNTSNYESNYRNHQNYSFNNYQPPPHRNYRARTPDFIFKNPNFAANHQNSYNNSNHYQNSFPPHQHNTLPFAPRTPNYRPEFTPYQTNRPPVNRTTHSYNHYRTPNQYDDSYERPNYAERCYGERSYNERRTYNERTYDEREYGDRPNFDERSTSYERLNSYKFKSNPHYEKSNYRTRSNSFDKSNQRYEDDDDDQKNEKSLKSLIVLPKR